MIDQLDPRIVVTCVVGLVAIGFELRTGLIPNQLTLPSILIGLAVGMETSRGWESFAGLGVSMFVALLMFQRGALAGGGAKLLMALGACAGLTVVVVAWPLAFAMGAGGHWWRSRRDGASPGVPSSPLAYVAVLLGFAAERAMLA